MAKTEHTRRSRRQPDQAEEPAPQTRGGAGPGAGLEELDAFIEKVLEEAGEEFLDEFRQIEGQ